MSTDFSAPVAQLDRAAGFEPVGRGFDSSGRTITLRISDCGLRIADCDGRARSPRSPADGTVDFVIIFRTTRPGESALD